MSVTRNSQPVRPGKIFLLVLLFCMGSAAVFGQTFINDNIINSYASVDVMYTYESTDKDSVVVTDASAFSVDDIVMLYQPKGFLVDSATGDWGTVGVSADIGEYAFLVIERIEGNTIIFNNSTDFGATKDYTVSQLIKVAVYDSALINSSITAPAWDSATGTGGVVAMYVKGRLQLRADIDVSGKGFKGAQPSPTDTYSGGCYGDDVRFQQRNYPLSAFDTAGLKGEGAAARNTLLARGKGRVMNGGGGGNASFSGGGGGGNYFSGGDGYGQSSLCSDPNGDEAAGKGGFGLFGHSLYTNTGNRSNRIFFGGGGGTGVYDAGGLESSAGGDGGGIVVIVADEIYSDNLGGIYADGMSVTEVSDGAGGGGGAGGCIVLDANRFSGQVKLSATGGMGGSTTDGGIITGPGGGGAGGVYWLRYFDSDVIDTINNVPSNEGTTNSTVRAQPGGGTRLLSNLEVPLRGFLFNTLPPNDTVCSDVIPPPIEASLPKGGVKPYSYKWIQSPNGQEGSWVEATEVNDQMDYTFTSPLTDTTFFRRIVSDAGVLVDTSTIFTYVVVPQIQGNVIGSPDEICYGLTAESLEQHPDSVLRGADTGPGTLDTSYSWIRREIGSSEWTNISGITSDYFTPAGDTATTFYSRIVYSNVCADTSNAVQITVLPEITENTITVGDMDTICYGMQSDPITGTLPQNGAGPGSYTYAWQVSTDGIDWGTDPDSAVYTSNQPFNLSNWDATRFIRRVVYSGEDSTCVSISNTQLIRVLDTISNNLIVPDTDLITICQFDQLPDGGLDGTTPSGGDPGNYQYYWQVRDKAGTWADSASLDPGTKFNLQSFDDTTYIRRLVVSGDNDVCRSYTDSLVVGIVWKIENNVLTAVPETYCQDDLLTTTLTAGALSGGANGIGIEWQYRTEAGDWMPAPGNSGQENYDFPSALDETLYFRRFTWSEPTDSVCYDTTSEVKITVQNRIRQNEILLINEVPLANPFVDSICAGQDLQLTGTENELTGGDESLYAFKWEVSRQPDFSASDVAITPGYSIPDFRDSAFFRRIVVSGECEDTTSHLLVQPIELPTGRLVLPEGQEDQVCSSEDIPVLLEVEDLSLDPLARGYTVLVSYSSVNNSDDKEFIRTTGQDPLLDFFVSTDSAETYVYTLDQIIDDRGCISEVVDPNQPSILVFYSPEVTLTAADTLVCGPSVQLTATNKGGVFPPKWFASTVRSNLDGTDTVTFNTDWELEAEATLDFWYNDTVVMVYGYLLETSPEVGKACADSAYVTVTHFQSPNMEDSLRLAKDEFYLQQTYDLTQLVDPKVTIGADTWTVDNSGAGFADGANTIANGFKLEQEHLYTWTVENGRYPDGSYVCPPNIDEVILVQHDLRQYDGFSPNNDGFNQVFVIPGLIHATDFTFNLYNSWGTKIYTANKADTEIREVEIDGKFMEEHIIWDGYLVDEGTVASPGTYYYTLTFEIEGSTIEYPPKQGYIILRR